MDRHKNPPAAFAVLTEGIINNTDCNIHPLNEIRNLSAEQLCDILNRRYTLALEPGIRSVSPLREGADNPTSFIVNEEGNWHDFGASDDEHVHGDIIDFIRIRENVDFGTALEIIAAELGIELLIETGFNDIDLGSIWNAQLEVEDDNFDVRGVRESLTYAKKAYSLFNASESLQADYPDARHTFPRESRNRAYDFLEKQLAKSP